MFWNGRLRKWVPDRGVRASNAAATAAALVPPATPAPTIVAIPDTPAPDPLQQRQTAAIAAARQAYATPLLPCSSSVDSSAAVVHTCATVQATLTSLVLGGKPRSSMQSSRLEDFIWCGSCVSACRLSLREYPRTPHHLPHQPGGNDASHVDYSLACSIGCYPAGFTIRDDFVTSIW